MMSAMSLSTEQWCALQWLDNLNSGMRPKLSGLVSSLVSAKQESSCIYCQEYWAAHCTSLSRREECRRICRISWLQPVQPPHRVPTPCAAAATCESASMLITVTSQLASNFLAWWHGSLLLYDFWEMLITVHCLIWSKFYDKNYDWLIICCNNRL